MLYPKTPVNTILVQIEKKYQDEIVTESGIKFYKDTSYNPEWCATATGKVVSIPSRLSDKVNENGVLHLGDSPTQIFPEVEVGDELFFGYSVIEEKQLINGSECFRPVEGSQNTLFENGNKEKVQLKILGKRLAICLYTDSQGNRIDGCQGTPDECIKWLGQFSYAGDEHVVYKNLLPYNGEDYWMVDYLEAKGVKRGEEIIMIAGNVLCEELKSEAGLEVTPSGLFKSFEKVDQSKLKVVSAGRPLLHEPDLGLKAGDMIKVIPSHVQKYELWSKSYTMIDQRSILGKL